MSNPSEFVFSQSSSPKLPAIGESRNLVSQPLVKESRESIAVVEKEKQSIPAGKNGEDVDANEEKTKLITFICRAFITALQRNNEIKFWNHLCEVLELSKPYSTLLRTKQICHYAERAYGEIQGREELQFVSEYLDNFFPDFITSLQTAGKAVEKKRKFPSGPTEDLPLPPRIRNLVNKGIRIPRGEQNAFSSVYMYNKQIDVDPTKVLQPKGLTLNDLKISLADVVREISARDSVLGVPLGMAALAVDVDLPITRVPTPPQTPKRSTSATSIHVKIDEDLKIAQIDQKAKKEKVFVPRTGREIVESFIKGNFLGELRFAYVNLAPSKRYDPYNLIEVPKDKANLEHFIISSHSILHVSDTGPSESQTLSEWYTEASIFQAILNLSFFKNFLLRKMFLKWKELKKHTFFINLKSEVELSLLHNVPTFGSALIRISALLNDLAKVTFLPFESNYCYSLEGFEEATFKASETGQMYLNKFFNYCQMVVDKTEENCFEYLRYCEALVRNHRHNYRESLAIAKEKQNIRQKNLRLAREEVTKLGNFVTLVDHIIFQNLLTVAQTNICKFVDITLSGPRPERDGLFRVYVIFDENHLLSLSPSTKQLSHSLSSAIDIVLTAVCSLSHGMDLGEETKSFIINASKTRSSSTTLVKNNCAVEDTQEEEEVKKKGVDYTPIPESNSELNETGSESGSEIGLDFLVSPENMNMRKGMPKTPLVQVASSTSQDVRTEAEIAEDIEDFNTSLASARELRQIFSEPLCSKRKQENVLVIEGQKCDQHGTSLSPLTREKLEQTLYHDEKIRDALKYHEDFVAESVEEVQEFCNKHNWLADIHKFVSAWDASQVEYWKSQPTSNIEHQLHQIQIWIEQVAQVIKTFSTANGLLYVDCLVIQNDMIPQLNNIFKQMVKMVASQVLLLSQEVIVDMERLSESLKDQRVEIRGFAEFILKLGKVKSKVPNLKDKVEHIKNLFEVIRSCYRQLSVEEEITEEKVWSLWESFLFGLQEASDFVQIQKPQIIEKITEVISSLEEEAFVIGRTSTTGRFLDSKENPTSILMAMRKLRDRYLKIRIKLKDISKWKEIITGSSYDLTRVLAIYDSIDKRQELWRYCEASNNTIKDFLNSSFKKVNVKRAIDKVNEWLSAGRNLRAHISSTDDVLSSWMAMLEEFVQDLPQLQQLSSDALKPRHWKSLFIGIGQDFDSSMLFTTATLLSFNLGRYKDLISAICAGANKEHALDIQLTHLSKAWREREFKLAKHIPLMRARFGAGKASQKDGQKKKKRTKIPLDQPGKIINKPRTPAFVVDSFTLIGIGELKCILEDNLITLKSMLVSPYVADLKPSVEYWVDSLNQIELIVDMWTDCQRKWLYLSNVFSEPNILREFPDHVNDFILIDNKYREFIQVISRDARMLSVIQKNRGEAGWRELQGEAMRVYLLELIQEEEELIKVVDVYIQQARCAFPRLYFLSDNALLSLLAWSRNPKDLLPFVKMCFPGIKSLYFALPRDSSLQLTTALDVALNAHLMEVMGMEGLHGEHVQLIRPIPASPRPQKWLANLEQNMRDTLIKELGDCVQSLLKGGITNVTGIVEHFSKQGNGSKESNLPEHSQDDWLVRFPSQCVLTSHAATWVRQVSQTLTSGRLLGLSTLRSELLTSIDDLTSAIRKNTEWQGDSPIHKRLELLLASLLTQTVHHRDVVNGLIDDRVSSLHSFEWQSELRPEIEIIEVISSSYDGQQASDNRISGLCVQAFIFSTLYRNLGNPQPAERSQGLDEQTINVKRSQRVGLCTVKQLGSSSPYGYEYHGPSSRLVRTPLTKRCFLTLNMAMQAFKCGTPHGSDGTGKTETIRELSKVLGRHLVMFDCSHSLASPMLVRYLSGMVCAGSWVCFENIDSVTTGVLSVFGQHLEKIRGSLKALKRDFYSQYTVRRCSTKDQKTVDSSRRRSSVASLTPLYGEKSLWQKPDIEEGLKHQRRRLSITESHNIPESSYYQTFNKPTKKVTSSSDDQILGATYLDSNGTIRYKDDMPDTFTMPLLGNIVFNSQLMAASEMYGCFMTVSSYYNSSAYIPENLKALLRPIAMIVPDVQPVLEVSMRCCGFTEAKPLANKVLTFFKMISDQVSCQAQYDFSLRSMRSVITLASKQLRQALKKKANEKESDGGDSHEAPTRSSFLESFERRQTEENSVVHGIFHFFGNKLESADKEVFSATLDSVFVHSVLMSMSSDGDPVLQDELKEYFQANGLQIRPKMISKAIQLYQSIHSHGKTIVLGSAGSGKTTLHQALLGAINNLNTRLSANVTQRKIPKTTSVPSEMTVNIECINPWPKIDVMVVYPKSMTSHELFGQMDSAANIWRDGLISKYLRDTNTSVHTKNGLQSLPFEERQRVFRGMGDLSRVEKWLVFDGPMDDLWMGPLNTVLDSTRALSLGNGGSISIPDTVYILFETSDLSLASPSLVTRCSVVHCSDTLIGWKSFLRSWIKTAHSKWDVSSRGLGIISNLMDHVVESTLDFLQKNCNPVLTADCGNKSAPPSPSRGIYEVQTLLRYLSALFDQHILREADDHHHLQALHHKGSISMGGSTGSRTNSGISSSDSGKVVGAFAFAFVWSFGGHIHHSCKEAFDEHARRVLSSGPYPATIPEEGLVYDYYLDFFKGTLVKWEDRPGAQFKTLASSFTVVPELDRYFFLMDLMVSAQQPVLLVGETGSGKSSLIQNLMSPRHSYQRIFMSPGFSCKLLQETIESKVNQLKRRDLRQVTIHHNISEALPASSTKSKPQLVFLDDLSFSGADETDVQPPLELLRQMLAQGYLYNKDTHQCNPVHNIQFLATAVPPSSTSAGSGVTSHVLSSRLTRLMTVLSFFPVSSETLTSIYSGVFHAWLQEFPAYSLTHHSLIAKAMAIAAVNLFDKIRQELRPTPLNPHLIFTQHDLARVAQSMSLFSTSSRARPRPRIRRRGADRGMSIYSSKTDILGELNGSYPDLHGKEGKKIEQDSSTIDVKAKRSTFKTPAVLSPLIRSLFRLWCHENTRTYCDRLLDEDQRFWFASVLNEQVEEHFCKGKGSLELMLHEYEAQKILEDEGEDMFGVAPGSNAPPPSAKGKTASSESLVESEENDGADSSKDEEDEDENDEESEDNEDGEEEGDDNGNSTQSEEDKEQQGEESDNEDSEEKLENQDDEEEEEEGPSEPSTSTSNTLSNAESQAEKIECTFSSSGPRTKVTFGDIKELDDEEYKGPLITFEQLTQPGEDLTDIIFNKHFNASAQLMGNAPDSAARGYVECTNGILDAGVNNCVTSYNSLFSETSSFCKIKLVTFRQALQHAARISRALATQGGHALLLSCLGYGRRALVRLASFAAGFKLMELQSSHFQSNQEQRHQIKAASYVAGVQGKPVVLFVPEDQTDDTLQDICAVMVEGTCSGLYTSNELSMISSQLLPGGQRGARRTEHQDIAQERFFRRVKSNLHVVICLKYEPLSSTNSPSTSQLYKFPLLFTRCCCVDAYLPWPHEALTSIADKLIREEDPVFDYVPWNKRDREAQLTSICSIMAHVHLSARSMVQKIHGAKGLKIYSPDDYLDFVELFKKFCVRLCVKEEATVSRLKHGLKRMEEATSSIEVMNSELVELTPQCNEGHDDVKHSQQSIEATQKSYQEQKEACKTQELEVEKFKAPVDKLKKESQEEFGKVSPLFDAALKAIQSLDVHDVEEIRSYRVPPFLVELVANSICLLFKRNQTWEQSKMLFGRDNFFKDLEFYNIQGMTDSMFKRLKVFYDHALFKPETVKDGSVAAASLCMWVRAVYEYAVVYRTLKPKQKQIKEAEKELEEAKTKLGEMKVQCNAIKQELEQKIEVYKESVKQTKNIEKKIQAIESRKSRAAHLVNSLNDYHESWKKTLDVAQQHLATSPGDALIAAACVCYFGPLNKKAREELFLDWLKVCDGTTRETPNQTSSLALMMLRSQDFPPKDTRTEKETEEDDQDVKPIRSDISLTNVNNKVALREGISLASILTEKDELTEWIKEGLPDDDQAVQNALIMRTCSNDRSCWPLLIDPHGQAEKWVQALMAVKRNTSTTETFDRPSSESSRRRSSPSRVPSTLDYQDLSNQDDDDDHISNMENSHNDVVLSELKDCNDDEGTARDSDSPMTAITDQTAGSTVTTTTDKTIKERLAHEMGLQVDSPDMSAEYAPTPNLDIDEGQIMVIPADDHQLRSKLRAAAIAGVVVLVTHMERTRWNKKLWLLLSRQLLVDNSANTKKIVIGKSAVECHPSFRLFFSSAVPLYMVGEGLVPLPLSKTGVIDMSLSQEGVANCLLTETLTLERPEYEGQKRSLERDLTIHEQQILNAQEFVLDKVLELKQPLLKDSTMLANVNKSKDVISTAGDRHQESLAMRKQMQAKRDDFLPVARHGAMLYTIICQMHKIRPAFYHMPFDTYLKLFRETIAERKRNKKNLGSPAARAAELISALSRMIYARMSWGLFLGDNLVFPFLMSVEKLLSENEVTEEEWQLFIYRQPLLEHLLPPVEDDDKPHWVTSQAWRFLTQLETLPPFKDLRSSLIDYPEEWREYFMLPPVLLANTPGDFPFLTVFQKALLWRVFREHQMFQVCQDFVLYVMGATMVHPVEYDIHQVYLHINNATPVVFMLPPHHALSLGTSATRDPNEDILDLARTHGKATYVATVCLGESSAIMHALHAVQRGMDLGHWVVIKNAHLTEHWPQEFLDTLQVITSTPQITEEHENEAGEWSEDYESRTTQSRHQALVHPEFRLFFTVRVDSGKPLPAILIQRGLKLACESKISFRSSIKQALQVEACSINSWSPHWKETVFKSNSVKSAVPPYAMYALAYFHSLMLCRRQYGSHAFTCPYQWSYPDIRGTADMLRHLTRACIEHVTNTSDQGHLLQVALADILAGVTYNGHVIDDHDWEAVKSMAMSVCSSELIKNIDGSQKETPVEERLRKFPAKPSLDQLGLVKAAETQYCVHLSRTMGVAFETSMELSPPRFNIDKVIHKVNEISDDIDECLRTIKKPEQETIDTALSAFFVKELGYYKQSLYTVSKDLHLLLRAMEGNVAHTPYLHSLMETVYQGGVPQCWYSRCSGPTPLSLWVKHLSFAVRAIQSYTTLTPGVICLDALVHHQAFFSCVLRDFCKKNSKAPPSLVFSIEVMQPSFEPKSPAEQGVFLSGVTIKNALWDTDRGCLTDLPSLSAVNQLPIILLTLVEAKVMAKTSGNEKLIVYPCPLITEGKTTTHLHSIVTNLNVMSAISHEDLVKRKVCLAISFRSS